MSPRSGQTRRPRPVAAPALALRRLRQALPNGAAQVLARLRREGAQAVVVGGIVREAFLSGPAGDWDIATDLVPARVAELFPRVVRTGEKHGTIMVLTADGPVEVTTFRSEGPYLDGRRPAHVAFHGDLLADLSRRDFTINALAADLERGDIIDPFGGLADLRARRIRCVGAPEERFAEDGLRPLRAVRFAGVLGFAVDAATQRALRAALPTFEKVAWERKRDELTRLLGRGQAVARSINLLASSGMLALLAPELVRKVPRLSRLDDFAVGAPWLRFAAWAALCRVEPADARAVLTRWRVATRDGEHVESWLSALQQLPARAPAGRELRRWLAQAGEQAAAGAAALAALLRPGTYAALPPRVRRALATHPVLQLSQLAIGGDDLVRLGLRGPAIGTVLRQLLAEVVDDPEKNEPAILLDLAHRLSTASG